MKLAPPCRPTGPTGCAAAARGAAALVVVMVLFFIMSLVAAYTSRNLIFEQRTSANNYRSTQALEAADAGLEWAIAMLNGGRIDAACQPSTDTAQTTFRERYLLMLAGGQIDVHKWPVGGSDSLQPSCVKAADGWSCSCPTAGAPTLTAPAAGAAMPAFRVSFAKVDAQPGVVRVFSQGCSSLGQQCYSAITAAADSTSEVNALVGLTPALTQAPAAALTVRGGLDPGDAVFVADVPGAVAVNSGGPVNPTITAAKLVVPPGSPLGAVRGRLVSESDPTLSNIAATSELSAGENFFLATFGVPPDALRLQPAVVRLTCGSECRDALQQAADTHPGRILWVDGDLNVDASVPLTLGGPGAPVILVVDGNLTFAAGSDATIHGLVYSRGTQLDATGATTVALHGALIAEGDPTSAGAFVIAGAPQMFYDADLVGRAREVVARQVLDFGSFTRVPGSWRDFR